MKKFLSLFIFVFCVAFSANAQSSGVFGGDLSWNINDGVLTISGEGAMPDYTSGSETPWAGKSFTSVVIEEGVTSVGDYAFEGFYRIKSVTIPASVERLGFYAFHNTAALKEIYWYGKSAPVVTYMGMTSEELGMEELTVDYVFSNITIGNITLYYTVNAKTDFWEGFGKALFGEGNGLSWILKMKDGVLDIKGEGNTAFSYFEDWDNVRTSIKSVSLSGVAATYSAPYITSTDGKVIYFACANGSAVVIPEGVTEIAEKSFYKLNIVSLEVASTVTKIGSQAFDGCTKLLNVTALPEVAPALGTKVFAAAIKLFNKAQLLVKNAEVEAYNSWKSYFATVIREIVTSGTFSNSGSWNFENHTLTVEGDAILDYAPGKTPWNSVLKSVKNIVVGDGVSSIGEFAFNGSTATNVSINSSVETISDFAFGGVAADFTFGNNSEVSADAIDASKTKSLKIVEVDRGDYTSADDLFVEATNTYNNVTLVRSFANGASGTIILPFDYISNGDLTFYVISGYNASKKSLVFDEVLKLEANTPYLWKNNSGRNVTELSVSGEVILDAAAMQGEHAVTANGWTMYGIYVEEKVFSASEGVNSNLWVFNSKGSFDNYRDYIWVDPYRAYFYGPRYSDIFPGNADKNSINGVCNGRSLSVEFNNIDGTTSIENVTVEQDGSIETLEDGACYDLSGRRVENPTRGLYIVNGKKVLVK